MFPKLTVAILLMVSMQRGGGGTGVSLAGNGDAKASEQTPFEQFADKLKIDEKKQMPDVQRIFTAAATEAQPIDRELMRARLRMLQAGNSATELKSATDAYAEAEAKMIGVEIKAFKEVLALLKPGQTSKSVEAFEVMAGLFNLPTPRAGRGRGGSSSTPSRLTTFTQMFSLDEDQKKNVKKILDDDYKSAGQLRASLSATREPIGIALRDNKEAAGAITAYAAAAAEMAAAEMKALAQVVSVAAASKPPEASTVQTAASMMRGAFAAKKWDAAPDTRFY